MHHLLKLRAINEYANQHGMMTVKKYVIKPTGNYQRLSALSQGFKRLSLISHPRKS
jgi:hypothetical protein